ncbi:hypothetical protein IPV09_02015 [Tessaracoccus sp. SD287]|uniref:hypothetical protein n=1 Tax=Tessaracoccus sp. SD287 TaxID=2782008 RepID=UPI001A96344F|nr:hypothetical protein [Tessaracoccus sp. SD287]MBO1030108.1 hypothetical protein [Tessaracoccus sp. SD287]
MCSPTQCNVCGKTTWSGCGQHIDQVKAHVSADQWCDGHAQSVQPVITSSSGLFKVFGR